MEKFTQKGQGACQLWAYAYNFRRGDLYAVEVHVLSHWPSGLDEVRLLPRLGRNAPWRSVLVPGLASSCLPVVVEAATANRALVDGSLHTAFEPRARSGMAFRAGQGLGGGARCDQKAAR